MRAKVLTQSRLRLLVLLSAAISASAQTVDVNGQTPPNAVTSGAGSSVEISVSEGPGNRTDWIALSAAVDSTAAAFDQQLDDSVGIAQRFLQAAYPELKGNVTIDMESDTESDWRTASVIGVSVRVFDRSSSTHERIPLVAHLQITRGRLSSVLFRGSYVDHDDLKAIVASARRQDDTREHVIEELKKAGLRFMEDDKAFLDAARLQRLEPVLGKIATATARFAALPRFPTPVDYEHQPMWVVELQTTPGENVTSCYDVLVEPVNLRLLRISDEMCAK
jgi:hypothetical protein